MSYLHPHFLNGCFKHLIPLGNSFLAATRLVKTFVLAGKWPEATSQLAQKISCEAPKALRCQEGAFPNGIKIWGNS